MGNSFWLACHIVNKFRYKYQKDPFNLFFERNGLLALFLKRSILRAIFNVLTLQKMFAGHIKVLCGPMWPTGRTLSRPVIKDNRIRFQSLSGIDCLLVPTQYTKPLDNMIAPGFSPRPPFWLATALHTHTNTHTHARTHTH